MMGDGDIQVVIDAVVHVVIHVIVAPFCCQLWKLPTTLERTIWSYTRAETCSLYADALSAPLKPYC
jgi:hypothetical protein